MPEPKVVVDFSGVPLWYVTFADLSTLMLTFFVLLLSFANMDVVMFREMLGSVKDAFGAVEEKVGKAVPYQAGEELFKDTKKDANNKELSKEEKAKQESMKSQIEEIINSSEIKDNASVFIKKDQLVIRVDGGTFFKSGSSKFQKSSFPLLKGLVGVLNKTDYTLAIEGHTDNVPINSKRYPSNWELSGVRATTILRYFIYKKIDQDRLRAIGYADTRPVMDNETPEGRAKNRRVEFILEPGKSEEGGESKT